MFAGTALSVRVFVYAGLSLFIINGPYFYVVVCVLYAYNLTVVLVFWCQRTLDIMNVKISPRV